MSAGRLDPRTKLALGLAAMLAVLFTRQPLTLGVEALLLLAGVLALNLVGPWCRSLRLTLPMALLVFLIAVLAFDLPTALQLALRLLNLLTASFILFQKLSPEELGDGLRKLGLPYAVCFILTTSMRYVPLLGRKLRNIMDAQRSRGIDLRFRLGNAGNLLALLLPLLIQSFLLSDELAMAMEARGFGSPGRSRRRPLQMRAWEYGAVIAVLALLHRICLVGAGGVKDLHLTDFLGRFTLIAGEVNRGKTRLTQRILELFCREFHGPLAVVDLAPRMVEPTSGKAAAHPGIGGRLAIPAGMGIGCFHRPLHAPRLQAKTEAEAWSLAGENARAVEELFREALSLPCEALFVNDCSLYLHAGRTETLLGWIRAVETAVVNGYYGQALGPGPISERERAGMEKLMTSCDNLIQL